MKSSAVKRKKLRKTIIVVIAALGLLGIFSFRDNDFRLIKSLDIYYTLFRELNTYYVEETDPEKLVKTSIDAMLESLDPYTVFIPESDLDEYKFMTTGKYGGIGAQIRKVDNNYVISETSEGYPASKAGIKAGDIIREIDHKNIYQKNSPDISELLKGDPQTEIVLTLERPGEKKTFTKTLIRERITIDNVPYFGMINEETGYIRLSNFMENASLEVRDALRNLKKSGATRIILDLRNNPGGLLGEAIAVSNLFLDKGQEVVQTRGKLKQWQKTFTCQNPAEDSKIPLVILVNQKSASASEIVAGSMQDLDRAVIIGQRTFGKGLVQATRPLSYNTQLKITTAKYYIPSGRCIQARDYTHRKPNGEATLIPDSLTHPFLTKNNRKVFDGGGILPDVLTVVPTLSRLSYNLYVRNFIFNYATEYAREHANTPSPVGFLIDETEYKKFINYLNNRNFDYVTESEDALKKLKDIASKERYAENSREEFEALTKKLGHDKQKDYETYKDEIKDLLAEEIISRYYHQKGRIQVSLIHDNEVIKAKEILSNNKLYSSILNGTSGNVAQIIK